MSKRLTITYGDTTLYDDTPAQLVWAEVANGTIKVEAGPAPQKPASFAEQLAEAAQRAQASRPALKSVETGPEATDA